VNPIHEMYRRTARLATIGGVFAIVIGAIGIVSPLLGSRVMGVVLVFAGICGIIGGRKTSRLTELPIRETPNRLTARMRATLLLVPTAVSGLVGYFMFGGSVAGGVVMAIFIGALVLIGLRLGDRLVDQQYGRR
jgi:FtsH-binding integral membrane protein